jgi:tripartite-type tricarboxylate transporter receptor subunit TctC
MSEAGLPGYEENNWNGMCAPATTPRDGVLRLNRDVAKAMATPELRERVAALGNVIVADSPDEFAAYGRKELEKWARLAREVNLKAE